jgi:hypothetical protein
MRINTTVTLTPGTPLNVAAQFTAQPGAPLYADRVFIQMRHGGTGLGYVLDLSALKAGTTPDKTHANQVASELDIAGATGPGGSWGDTKSPQDGNGIDLNQMWVDGDQADPCLISVNLRV